MATEMEPVVMVVIAGRRYRKGSTEAKQAQEAANKMRDPGPQKRATVRERGWTKGRTRMASAAKTAGEAATSSQDQPKPVPGPEGAQAAPAAPAAAKKASAKKAPAKKAAGK